MEPSTIQKKIKTLQTLERVFDSLKYIALAEVKRSTKLLKRNQEHILQLDAISQDNANSLPSKEEQIIVIGCNKNLNGSLSVKLYKKLMSHVNDNTSARCQHLYCCGADTVKVFTNKKVSVKKISLDPKAIFEALDKNISMRFFFLHTDYKVLDVKEHVIDPAVVQYQHNTVETNTNTSFTKKSLHTLFKIKSLLLQSHTAENYSRFSYISSTFESIVGLINQYKTLYTSVRNSIMDQELQEISSQHIDL